MARKSLLLLLLLALAPASGLARSDEPAFESRANCYSVDYRHDAYDVNGPPLEPGDTIHIQGHTPVSGDRIYFVELCFYRFGAPIGHTTLTDLDHDIIIGTGNMVVGDIFSMDFGGFSNAMSVKVNIQTAYSTPPSYEYTSDQFLPSVDPSIPSTTPAGLAVLCLLMGGVLIRRRRQR